MRQFGDPVLKTRALEVETFDDELRTQVARMAALMDDALGVGLAPVKTGENAAYSDIWSEEKMFSFASSFSACNGGSMW